MTQLILGTEIEGTSSVALGDYLVMGLFQAAFSADNINKVRIYSAATGTVKVAVYEDNIDNDQAGARLGYNDTEQAVVAGWNELDVSPFNIVQDVYYWIAAITGTSGALRRQTSGGSYGYWGQTQTFSSFTFPITAPILNRSLGYILSANIYATPAGAAVEYLDDFNRADAATLGVNWTVFAGSVGISSSRAAFTDAGFTAALWNVDSFAADQDVFCTVAVKPTTNNTSSVGVLARFDAGSGNGYLLTAVPQSGTDTIRLWRVTGGVATQLGADILAEYAVGNRIKLAIGGTTLSAYLDTGAGWTLLGTRTDSTYEAGGRIGIYGTTATGAIDDFGGGNIEAVIIQSGFRFRAEDGTWLAEQNVNINISGS